MIYSLFAEAGPYMTLNTPSCVQVNILVAVASDNSTVRPQRVIFSVVILHR